jgi:CHAT domain-containing protein/tetratricopeptide (TPR) repeat protein
VQSSIETLVAQSEELLKKKQFAGARDAALKALEAAEDAGNSLLTGRAANVLAKAANLIGDRQVAIDSYHRAIAAFGRAGDRRARAVAALDLANLMTAPPDEKEPLFQGAVADASAAGDRALVARIYHAWGDSLFMASEYEAALDKLEAALAEYRMQDDAVARGTVHTSIGRVFRAHGRSDLALAEQLKALALHEHGPSRHFHLQSLNAVAVTYQSLGDAASSRPYFERALQLAEKPELSWLQDFVRGNFAWTLMEEGDYATAARQLEQVIAHGVDAYPSIRYRDLAAAYTMLNRPDDALVAAHKSVELCRTSLECVYAYGRRGRVHAASKNTAAATTDLRTALDRLEDTRARLVPRDFLKQQFSDAQRTLYTEMIALQVAEGDARGGLETAELARARALLDLLAGNDLSPATETSPLSLVLRGAKEGTANGALDSTAVDLPSAASTRPFKVDDLLAVSERVKSTLVMYWVADDAVYIWVVRSDGRIHSVRSPITASNLRTLVGSTSAFATAPPPGPAAVAVTTRGDSHVTVSLPRSRAWRDLYDVLIRPIRGWLPRERGSLLTIVPDRMLTSLPFAALQDEHNRYFLEDYALHYVPAASVLQFTAQRRQHDARRSKVVLIADPEVKPRSRLDRVLPRLPGARAEVRAISQLLPEARTTTVADRDATEDRVRGLVTTSGILHFATHAIVSDQNPFTSFLALSASPGGNGGDGLLTASEIYGLKLSADLVVLSACRSGGGAITGDGIATFARAFLAAGAASLVTSMWDVADQPTHRLIPAFYRSWLQGTTKAAALRAAQLHLLAELRAGKVAVGTPIGEVTLPEHPAFWAGFALIGEPD